MATSSHVKLSNPWLLSAIPAVAYTVAYLNRLAEAQAHRIPLDWIVVSPTDALSRTAGTVTVVGVIAVGNPLREWARSKTPVWLHQGIGELFFALTMTAFGLLLAGSARLALALFITFALYAAVRVAIDYRRRDRLSAPVDIGVSRSAVLEPVESVEFGDLRIRISVVLAIVVAMIVLSYIGGYERAFTAGALVTADNSRIVAATYGDKVVLADFSVSANGVIKVRPARQLTSLISTPPISVVETQSVRSVEW